MPSAETNEPLAIRGLLLCAKPHLDAPSVARIREFAKRTLDWEESLAMAATHALTPIFCKNLEKAAPDLLSPSWRERFRSESLRNSCRNLAKTAELFHVLQALEAKDVCATPYKGPVLAVQAYGDMAMRQFSDLDILLPQAQIATADRAMLEIGFSRAVPWLDVRQRRFPGQYAYRNGTQTMVELHTERTLRYFPRRLDLAELCKRRELMNLAGREVLAFSPQDTLLLLSVHGSKHFWERLGWIADIAALMQTQRAINWNRVWERARAWRVQRMVLLGAGLATEIFDADLPPQLSDCLRRDPAAQKMIAAICKRFLASTQTQLGIFARFAFRVRMLGSLLEGVPYAMRLTFQPTEQDRNRRAPFFEPLYALRRPLRLARTYGWRTRAGS